MGNRDVVLEAIETDVVVLGFGAAGCAAAIEAHDAGAEVVVLEKMPEDRAGGNTRVSGSIWIRSSSPDRAAAYLRSLCGDFPIPEEIVQVWATETARNTEWVAGLGAEVMEQSSEQKSPEPEFPEMDGSDALTGRMHVVPSWGGGPLFDALSTAVLKRGIDVRYETPAVQLLQDPSTGAITGVVATHRGQTLRFVARRGVVLATGGFEFDAQMVRDHLGLVDTAGWGSPGNTGDGIKMAQKVGAGLWHMNNHLPIVGIKVPELQGAIRTEFPHSNGYVYVGLDGRRFVNETMRIGHGHALLNGRYELFPHQPMNVVFDERTRRAGPISKPLADAPHSWTHLVERYEWSADNSAEIARGWITRGDTVAELATAMGMDPDVLERSLEEYDAGCRAGNDARFGRDPATMIPLDEPPYYGFRWGSTIVYTCGGPRRDERARVIDALGAPIPRLYCAGEISSTYSFCMDGGMMIADALAFGRVAGRGAAAETPEG